MRRKAEVRQRRGNEEEDAYRVGRRSFGLYYKPHLLIGPLIRRVLIPRVLLLAMLGDRGMEVAEEVGA